MVRPRPTWSVGALLLGSCAISIFAARYVSEVNQRADEIRFRGHAEQFEHVVASRLEAYTNSLVHTRALVAAFGSVDVGALHRYIREVHILEKYPGTLGIGYLERVKAPDLPEHIRRMRRTIPHYHVWPEGQRDEYYPITHYEPENESNQKILGFDASVWPNRREAQERAIATGEPAATGRIPLVRDMPDGKTPGFVFFAAIFRAGAPINTPAERKEAVIGMFNSTFRGTTFFETLLRQNPIPPKIEVEVYDGNALNAGSLLYSYGGGNPSKSGLTTQGHIEVGGRPWTFVFHALPGYRTFWSQHGHWVLLAMGLLISFLLSWMMWRALRQRETERDLVVQVRRALDARDEFISIASHELRTPITSLKIQLDMAELYGNRDPREALEKVTRIGKQQVARLIQLVNELLDVTRIQSGKMKFQPETIDLNQLAAEVLENYRASLRGNEHLFVLSSQPDPVVVHVDPFRMSQALENLLANAIKYGGSKPVQLTIEKSDLYGVIRVSDKGEGIPREKYDLIFQRFERLEASNNVSGLGLGLFITKQIVDAHHGRIGVESELGIGSTFTIEIPLRSQEKTS